MAGEKLARAREAAIKAIGLLQSGDIVSVVTYDSVVNVVVPATKVDDKQSIYRATRRITDGGSTALFAGVSKGDSEVRKFLDKTRVNRVILLSDGLANIRPSTPSELGQLGSSLGKEGISVTTIGLGLGYNEDLMTQLAGMRDGHHAFVQNSADLNRIFAAEFNTALTVVANQFNIVIRCADSIRPIRVLGRQAQIIGQEVHINLNQLSSNQEKNVMLAIFSWHIIGKPMLGKKDCHMILQNYFSKFLFFKRKIEFLPNFSEKYTCIEGCSICRYMCANGNYLWSCFSKIVFWY
jgi:Ca-activated chloride channel family protein